MKKALGKRNPLKMKNRLFLLQLGCSLLIMLLLLALISSGQRAAAAVDVSADAQKFIDEYTGQWLKLRYAYTQASWNSNTRIVEGDDTNSKAENAALEGLTAFTGSKENVEKASAFLKQREKLTALQVKQLKSILYTAGEYPETVKDLVKERPDGNILCPNCDSFQAIFDD